MESDEEERGISTGKKEGEPEHWWWNDEDGKIVKQMKDRLKKWKQQGLENDKPEYKSTTKRVVARVKAESVEGLYDNLDPRKASNTYSGLQLPGTWQQMIWDKCVQ